MIDITVTFDLHFFLKEMKVSVIYHASLSVSEYYSV
jgi:hypothetical protein